MAIITEATKDYASSKAENPSAMKARILKGMKKRETLGREPGCECEAPVPVPCLVLDLFGGSETAGLVALELGRDAVLLELNPEMPRSSEHG